jgi:hypothetical protein
MEVGIATENVVLKPANPLFYSFKLKLIDCILGMNNGNTLDFYGCELNKPQQHIFSLINAHHV